jgi:hypothetical protein
LWGGFRAGAAFPGGIMIDEIVNRSLGRDLVRIGGLAELHI